MLRICYTFIMVLLCFLLLGCGTGSFSRGLQTSRDVLRAACKAEKMLTAIQEQIPLTVAVGGIVDTASVTEDQVTVTIEVLTE